MPRKNQTPAENGDINENVDGGSFVGFFNKSDIPAEQKTMLSSFTY